MLAEFEGAEINRSLNGILIRAEHALGLARQQAEVQKAAPHLSPEDRERAALHWEEEAKGYEATIRRMKELIRSIVGSRKYLLSLDEIRDYGLPG